MKLLARSTAVSAVLAAFGFVLASCSGPSSPSAPAVTVLRGIVLDESASASASAHSTGTATAAAANVTVTVQEDPSLTATVGQDGRFTLTGLPLGTITLVFSRNGRVLGTLTIANVVAGEQLDIRVKVRGNGVTLLDLQRTSPSPSPEPSPSPSPEPSPSPSPEPSPSPSPSPSACMIHGGRVGSRIELEGSVTSGSGTDGIFTLRVQGNRSTDVVTVDATAATFQCSPSSGPNAPTPEACKANVTSGAKVHVSGTLQACDATTATAIASKVKVQQPGG